MIKVSVGEMSLELTVEEARRLYDELAPLFGESKPVQYVPFWYPPYQYPQPYEPYKITWNSQSAYCQAPEQGGLQPAFNPVTAGSTPAGASVMT